MFLSYQREGCVIYFVSNKYFVSEFFSLLKFLFSLQMRFQHKQQVEKEQKKIDLLGNATVRVGRISSSHEIDETKLLTSTIGAGKVRQMFEERRTGVDKSYPLKPISGNVGKAPLSNSDKTHSNGGVKAPPKSKSMNGIVLRQRPAQHTDNEYHNLDRDPLNNSVTTPARYNSTNRVPSLKNNNANSVTSNSNTINNNNNSHVVDGVATKQQFKPTSTSGGTNRAITPSTATANYPLTEKKPSSIETRKVSFLNCIIHMDVYGYRKKQQV